MRKAAWLAALLGLFTAVGTSSAQEPTGPLCFRTDQASSILKLTFVPTLGDTFLLNGQFITLFGTVPVMGTGFLGATQFETGLTVFAPNATTFLAGGINLSTLTGSLSCELTDGPCPSWHITEFIECP